MASVEKAGVVGGVQARVAAPVARPAAKPLVSNPDAFVQAGRGLAGISSPTGRGASIRSLLAHVDLPVSSVANDLVSRVSTSKVPVANEEGYPRVRAQDVSTIIRLAAA